MKIENDSENRCKRFQILALSGGGYCGLYSAAVLPRLEQAAERPLAQCFDLIAGTSIGGIVGLGIGLEKPLTEIVQAFRVHGTTIFSNRPAPRSWVAKGRDLCRFLFSPKYCEEGLRAAVAQIVGVQSHFEDLLHPTIIPTVNVTKGEPQFFKTPHHPRFQEDWQRRMVDVAMATSAAPTFFPLARVGGCLFADGGLYANAPDLSAVHEATQFCNADENEIHVLSIGTTTAKFSFSHRIGRNLGALRWLYGQRLQSAILSSQQQYEDAMMTHRLGNRYFRIDKIQSKEQQDDFALDVATPEVQEMLIGLGTESAKSALGDARMGGFLNHRAPPPVFYHGKQAVRER